jgi:3-methyl-2-oxobutanoate hydroxymethyltransferase
MILLEAIPSEGSGYFRDILTTSGLSIGAGPYCNGQRLIVSDMPGVFEVFTPRFAKRYGMVAKVCTEALTRYVNECGPRASRSLSTFTR